MSNRSAICIGSLNLPSLLIRRGGSFASAFRLALIVVLALGAVCYAPRVRAQTGTGDAQDEFQLFINVKKDIIARCIYRPTDSDVIWGALTGLGKQLEPGLAGLLPAPNKNSGSDEAWGTYKFALRSISRSPDCKLTLKALVEKSIQGYCHTLDAYCKYDDSETWAKAEKIKPPEYVGIGIRTLHDRTEDIICDPVRGGPADRAGVDLADKLIAINGHPTRGASTMMVHNWLYENGSEKVTIRVQHLDGKEESLTIPMQRVVTTPVSVEQTEDGVTIKIRTISKRSADDFLTAMRTIGPRRAITLDLRGNEGGPVEAGVAIASAFLPLNTPIGRFETLQSSDSLVSTNRSPYVPSKMTILQDRFTASAAELIIAALGAYPPLRVQTIGEKTYGKGVTQQTVKVSDTDNAGVGNIHAGVLTITDSRIYGPRNEVWDEKGLEPNR